MIDNILDGEAAKEEGFNALQVIAWLGLGSWLIYLASIDIYNDVTEEKNLLPFYIPSLGYAFRDIIHGIFSIFLGVICLFSKKNELFFILGYFIAGITFYIIDAVFHTYCFFSILTWENLFAILLILGGIRTNVQYDFHKDMFKIKWYLWGLLLIGVLLTFSSELSDSDVFNFWTYRLSGMLIIFSVLWQSRKNVILSKFFSKIKWYHLFFSFISVFPYFLAQIYPWLIP